MLSADTRADTAHRIAADIEREQRRQRREHAQAERTARLDADCDRQLRALSMHRARALWRARNQDPDFRAAVALGFDRLELDVALQRQSGR